MTNKTGVHASHCCIHNCKYGDDDCPVVKHGITGITCDCESPEEKELAQLRAQLAAREADFSALASIAAADVVALKDKLAAREAEVARLKTKNETLALLIAKYEAAPTAYFKVSQAAIEARAEVDRLREALRFGIDTLQFGGEPKTVLGRDVKSFIEVARKALVGE